MYQGRGNPSTVGISLVNRYPSDFKLDGGPMNRRVCVLKKIPQQLMKPIYRWSLFLHNPSVPRSVRDVYVLRGRYLSPSTVLSARESRGSSNRDRDRNELGSIRSLGLRLAPFDTKRIFQINCLFGGDF